MKAAGFLLLAAAASAGIGTGASHSRQSSFQQVADFPPAEVLEPAVISRTEPEFTEAARRARREGTVTLYVEIGRDGRAHHVRVIRGLGLGLNEKAMEAVRKWRFLPEMHDGVPVATPATIEVNFRLSAAPARI